MKYNMEYPLFADKRIDSGIYRVELNGASERIVCIRGGVFSPQAGTTGYLLLVGQLEKNQQKRFLVQIWQTGFLPLLNIRQI